MISRGAFSPEAAREALIWQGFCRVACGYRGDGSRRDSDAARVLISRRQPGTAEGRKGGAGGSFRGFPCSPFLGAEGNGGGKLVDSVASAGADHGPHWRTPRRGVPTRRLCRRAAARSNPVGTHRRGRPHRTHRTDASAKRPYRPSLPSSCRPEQSGRDAPPGASASHAQGGRLGQASLAAIPAADLLPEAIR